MSLIACDQPIVTEHAMDLKIQDAFTRSVEMDDVM